MHGLNSVYGIEVISWLRHHLSELNSLNSLISIVLCATAHGRPINFNRCSRKALLQQLLHVRNVEEQIITFVIICYKCLFGMISNLFRPYLIASLHLLAARRPLQLHCLCMTLLYQKSFGNISAISINNWLNYNRMNAFGVMENDSIGNLILNRFANAA